MTDTLMPRVYYAVYITTQNTLTQQAPTTFTMAQPYNASNINNPAVNFCGNPGIFKATLNSDCSKHYIAKYDNQYVKISCEEFDSVYIILDILGNIINKKTIQFNEIEIPKSSLYNGIYFIRIFHNEREYKTVIISIINN